MEKIILTIILTLIFSAAIFIPLGVYIRKRIIETKLKIADDEATKIKERAEQTLKDAEKEAENIIKDNEIKAREAALQMKSEIDDEIKERRQDISLQERRIMQKEEQLEKRIERTEKQAQKIEQEYQEIEKQRQEVENMKEETHEELKRVANLTEEEAKQEILSSLEEELVQDKARIIKENEDEINKVQKKYAQEIIGSAIQKCAVDHTSETTISVVSLPSDEMKGRIIGREGRNIKSLETLTGVQFIIDDTPEAIIISGFDPVRREVARIALEKLIDDGRIHPAKIEKVVDEAISSVAEVILEEGERAAYETGIHDLHEDLLKTLGKLKYRTSYGQNVLTHSIEVSKLARSMAAQLGLDAELAARGGLLHDIGKALDHELETEGTHIKLGVELLEKYKEDPRVINCVEAHHGDVATETVEAELVMAADAISASRPGARRDSFENYIKRLEGLENVANSFAGVNKAFAIQAGREVRLIVDPEKISDDKLTVLARDVAKKIEEEVNFPGEVKINVIREKREADYAKQSKTGHNFSKEDEKNKESQDDKGPKKSKEKEENKKNKRAKNKNRRRKK